MRPAFRLALLAVSLAPLLGGCKAPYRYEQKTPDELNADAGADLRGGDGHAALAKLDFLKSKFPEFPDRQGVDFKVSEAKKLNGSLWKSFVSFREFLERYPITSYFAAAEKHIFEIGTNLLQSRSSFLGTGLFRDSDDGVLVLNFLVEKFPSSSLADEALRRVAQYRFESGDYAGAILDYERILKGYPGSPWRDFAEYRIAIAHLRAVPRPDLDQSELRAAREALTNYLATRPEGARQEEARAALAETEELLAESEFRIGAFYERIDEPFGASIHYKNVVTEYPRTLFASRAERRLDALGDVSVPPSSR